MLDKYKDCDFKGWATRNDIRCTDGRTIRRDAFAQQDGAKVPLVWAHNHDSPDMVLGHGFLENRPEGVFFYGYFNDSDLAQSAKEDVQHGDVTCLSIWANHLNENNGDVIHGSIKEVSLVLAGANMGAQITHPIVSHSDDSAETVADEAFICPGEEYGLILSHADENNDEEGEKTMDDDKTVEEVLDSMNEDQLKVLSYFVAKASEEALAHADDEEEEKSDEDMTVEDVIKSMNPNQKKVLDFLVAKAAEDAATAKHSDMEDTKMNFNAFENGTVATTNYLSHSDEKTILVSAKKMGKLSDAVAAFAEEHQLAHDDDEPTPVTNTLAPVSGFTSYPNGATPAGVDALFPEYRDVYPGAPQLVTSDQAWVRAVLSKARKVPFSRIRTSSVDVRNIEEIRARGYAKGKEKVLAENYAVAKRATDPQTVYVRSALNHDDIVDITDFSYVDYQYKIDRMQLELEVARAMMIGDGRDAASADKISPDHIRPIYSDPALYTIRKTLTLASGTDFGSNYLYASAMEEALLDAKIDYKGTGTPDMFCTQQFFNKLMLAKDLNGHRLYKNKSELATALDVDQVYNVPEFANITRTETVSGTTHTYKLLAIIGNMADYALGQTKGGEIVHRTQFDIDFNQEKSLLETRLSGATTKLFSFIVIEEEVA